MKKSARRTQRQTKNLQKKNKKKELNRKTNHICKQENSIATKCGGGQARTPFRGPPSTNVAFFLCSRRYFYRNGFRDLHKLSYCMRVEHNKCVSGQIMGIPFMQHWMLTEFLWAQAGGNGRKHNLNQAACSRHSKRKSNYIRNEGKKTFKYCLFIFCFEWNECVRCAGRIYGSPVKKQKVVFYFEMLSVFCVCLIGATWQYNYFLIHKKNLF